MHFCRGHERDHQHLKKPGVLANVHHMTQPESAILWTVKLE